MCDLILLLLIDEVVWSVCDIDPKCGGYLCLKRGNENEWISIGNEWEITELPNHEGVVVSFYGGSTKGTQNLIYI
jgi:hypothetical protein